MASNPNPRLTAMTEELLPRLILDYLAHNGYSESAKAFSRGQPGPSTSSSSSANPPSTSVLPTSSGGSFPPSAYASRDEEHDEHDDAGGDGDIMMDSVADLSTTPRPGRNGFLAHPSSTAAVGAAGAAPPPPALGISALIDAAEAAGSGGDVFGGKAANGNGFGSGAGIGIGEMDVDDEDVGVEGVLNGFGGGGKGKGKAEYGAAELEGQSELIRMIPVRSLIRHHICNSNIPSAIHTIRTFFPTVLDESRLANNKPHTNGNGHGLAPAHSFDSLATTATGSTDFGGAGSTPGSHRPHSLIGSLASSESRDGSPADPLAAVSKPPPPPGASSKPSPTVALVDSFPEPPPSSSGVGGGVPPTFPYQTVYDNPLYLSLNLELQAFVDNLRNMVVPSSPSSSMASSFHSELGGMGNGGGSPMTGFTSQAMAIKGAELPSSNGSNGFSNGNSKAGSAGVGGGGDSVNSIVTKAQALYERIKALDPLEKEVYTRAVDDVAGLLAYVEMEASPLRGYLDQERRVALANQVDSAIMVSLGRASRPLLATMARHINLLWDKMQENDVDGLPDFTMDKDGFAADRIAKYLKYKGWSGIANLMAEG